MRTAGLGRPENPENRATWVSAYTFPDTDFPLLAPNFPLGRVEHRRRPSVYSSNTERMVSRIEYDGFHPKSFAQREPSTAQRNWMWSSSGGGKDAR